MLNKIKLFTGWLLSKTPEVRHLSLSDALLAKIVIDIKRGAAPITPTTIPLNSIVLIHPINRKTALEKIDERVKIITEHKEEFLKRSNHITNDILTKFIPSVTPIQVIPFKDAHLVFEGNGRLVALQKVFSDHGITIEVELFSLPKDSPIYSDIEKLQNIYTKNSLLNK